MNNFEDLDFEISLYEDILKEKPAHIDALIAVGNAYTRKGRFEDGLAIDLTLSRLRSNDPYVHYNLACSYSLLKNADKSFETLKKAIQLGYCDFDYMEEDADLAFVRDDPRYRELIAAIRNRIGEV
ncbi:MAG: hypothetical protein ABIJ27_03880 [Candidatus Omnitrophota bacterium]